MIIKHFSLKLQVKSQVLAVLNEEQFMLDCDNFIKFIYSLSTKIHMAEILS
jgi:hypothetical protein